MKLPVWMVVLSCIPVASCSGDEQASLGDPGMDHVDAGADDATAESSTEGPDAAPESGDGPGTADGSQPEADALPPMDPWAPLYPDVGSYATTIPSNGDAADVYYPNPPDLHEGGHAFPMAVLLQGANVDKQYYATFSRVVASYGFVVMVPNHESMSLTGQGLFMETQEVNAAMDALVAESATASPIQGIVDTHTLVLLGHSYGGVVGLQAIEGTCMFPFCIGSFDRPLELRGGAFYGTNTKSPMGGSVSAVANDGRPVALIQGDLDGKASPADTDSTYDKIQTPPKALVVVHGANHYGLCDVNNPPGAAADPSAPSLPQQVGTETAARWSALFLRAYVLNDPAAAQYVESVGDGLDDNVTVVAAH